MSTIIRHSSAVKPISIPITGSVPPADWDRLQSFNPATSQPSEKLYEIGRLAKMDTAKELLEIPKGTITREGVRTNNAVGVQYLEAWLNGNGCVPIYNLMEDAATSEISRTQIWQQIYHKQMVDGLTLTPDRFQSYLQEDLSHVRMEIGEEAYAKGKFDIASDLFAKLSMNEELADFLTLPAYELL